MWLYRKLKGDITFWHSFTQGPRMEVIQQTADQFMKDNPGVKIKIETFSWGDFYTKWTTGLASGNVPDMSTALPGHVFEVSMEDIQHIRFLLNQTSVQNNEITLQIKAKVKNDSQMYHLKLHTLWSPLKKDGYIGIVGYFDTVK